ncbi:MAG: hypothetical protein KY469_00210 [Actinobacteria bacterium]|nr:hypothetical protein [Actinomycetota bacterium]
MDAPDSDARTGLTADVDLPSGEDADVDLHDSGQRHLIEAAVSELPGVLAARIVPGYERSIDELHILATLDKTPKTLVRDVQSLLMARFAITIDHRVVSIVQMEDSSGVARAPRVLIREVTASQQGLESLVDVKLVLDDRELTGRARGPASAAGRRRTAARATLEALQPLLSGSRVVEVEGVAVQHILGHTVALSFVHIHTAKGAETVCGSALVRADEAEAVARSVLDAVNREIDEDSPTASGG